MQTMIQSILPLFFFFIGFSFPIPKQAHSSSVKHAPEIWQKEMLQRVNSLRAQGCRCGRKKMPPQKAVKWNETLAQAAHGHASDMHRNDFIGHRGSSGSRIGERVDRAGYNWQTVAENVAWNVQTVQGAVLGWKDSPAHCQTMMGKYQEMGAAKVGAYWVQVFASPMK
ncbi:MAG: CAP domain-containing protein [Bacteroidota bacterium]